MRRISTTQNRVDVKRYRAELPRYSREFMLTDVVFPKKAKIPNAGAKYRIVGIYSCIFFNFARLFHVLNKGMLPERES